MRDYSISKIYKIEPISGGDIGDCYYGSTTENHLSQRMAYHRSNFKGWKEKGTHRHYTSSFVLFDKFGLDNCQIILVENVNCKSKDELLAREAFYIKNNECINKRIPGRTIKQWSEDNKEIIRAKKRIYEQKNKEQIKEKHRNYCIENKQHLSENKKQYREKNDEEIKAKKNKKHMCECGFEFTHSNQARHCKTKRHQTFINEHLE